MNFLTYYNKRIIKHDLINKFKYKNNKNIPKLKKIIFNFGCKNFDIQKFTTTFLALEIITTKKGSITIAKTPNMLLKIQKGHPAGCKVTLTEKKIHKFLTRLYLQILPKIKNFTGFKVKIDIPDFSFKICNNELVLHEFEEQYPLFANLPNLDIYISTTAKTQDELLFLIKSLKFPIRK